jgi:hypothetical protein
MGVAVEIKDKIIIEKYDPWKAKCRFIFDPKTCSLNTYHNNSNNNYYHGWLIDMEKVISGPKQMIFFKVDDECYISFYCNTLNINKSYVLHHKTSIIFSYFYIIFENKIICKVKYLTPWWRYIFDDGLVGISLYPFRVIAKNWNEQHSFFANR